MDTGQTVGQYEAQVPGMPYNGVTMQHGESWNTPGNGMQYSGNNSEFQSGYGTARQGSVEGPGPTPNQTYVNPRTGVSSDAPQKLP